MKYRLPDGRQVQKKLGPAWTERGRPPAGYFTKRTAEDALRAVLDEARRGTLPGLVRTGATFADAAAEFLRYAEHDRGCKPSTLRDYRSNIEAHMLPAFGDLRLEEISPAAIDRWRGSLIGLSNRTKNKLLVVMHGIFRRAQHVWGLPLNPLASVERHPQRSSGDIDVFSPEEIWALVRAAASDQDGAVFLTAAFSGLRRGELLALRWRDVDFTGSTMRVRGSYAAGRVTTPKSGKVRSVPMAPAVAAALARLGERDLWIGDDDLVFVGELGSYLDGSALRRRYASALQRAGLRPLRFHDLRHTFGTRMIAKADIRRVQEWMGHADIQTTMRYLHYAPREGDAALVAEAFELEHQRMPLRTPDATDLRILGIVIGMYWNEETHYVPHFHAAYGGHFASIAFGGTVLSGSLPPRQLRLVRHWASQHQSELEANWERSRRRDALLKIDPLA